MKSEKFDQAACEALAQQVREIESNTDAEIVIVVRARSGPYRHADYLFGGLLAFTGLLFALFSPFDFHTYWVPIDVALLFAAGALSCSPRNLPRPLLPRAKLRVSAARAGAAGRVFQGGVTHTPTRKRWLMYLSLLET